MAEHYELKVTCPAAPTQVEGVAYGKYVYFRERYGAFAFGVGDNENDAVENSMIKPYLTGECPHFMNPVLAVNFVIILIELYSRGGEEWYTGEERKCNGC